jgi:iron(III) transport system substrate-binding protein
MNERRAVVDHEHHLLATTKARRLGEGDVVVASASSTLAEQALKHRGLLCRRARRAGILAVSALCATSLAASALASSADAARPWRTGRSTSASLLERLYHEALSANQTSVVVYGPSAISDGPLYGAFEKAFPKITVTGVPVLGPAMTAKLSAEFASGKHVADIAETGDTDMVAYAKSGWLVPYKPPDLPSLSKLPPVEMGPGGTFFGLYNSVFVLLYNTSAVHPSQVPTTWQQLLAPRWKGRLVMYDPTSVGPMDDVFAHLDAMAGYGGIMAGLHRQDVELNPMSNITGPVTDVATGAKDIAIEVPFSYYPAAKKAGAPVAVALLKAANYAVTTYTGLIKGAPDPLAAKLFEAYELTSAAARLYANEGEVSVILNAPSPVGLPPFRSIALMKPIRSMERQVALDNAAIKKAQAIWGS